MIKSGDNPDSIADQILSDHYTMRRGLLIGRLRAWIEVARLVQVDKAMITVETIAEVVGLLEDSQRKANDG